MRRTSRRLPRLFVAAPVAAALVLAGCSSDGPSSDGTASATPGSDPSTGAAEGTFALQAQVASFDVAVGDGQRLLLGLFSSERGLVVGGEATVQVGPLGAEVPEEATVEMSDAVQATFLPVPGNAPELDGDAPVLLDGSGSGVYETFVDLTEPGFWVARVAIELADGTTGITTTTFEVLAEHEVVAVGDEAPRSTNALAGDLDLPSGAIDSRAVATDSIPDEHLHDITIADAIAAGRPTVVVISTPVYCVSRFCGPITETLEELAHEYEDVAEVVHLEVWKDFESSELNTAAAEWIQTEAGGNEPWVFLVDEDGRIEARWDNVLDEAALRALLDTRR